MQRGKSRAARRKYPSRPQASRSQALYPQIRHLKRLHGAEFLPAIGEIKGIVHLKALEDIQTAIEQDLPACIGGDMSGVDSTVVHELPRERMLAPAAAACIFCKYSSWRGVSYSSRTVTRWMARSSPGSL